MRLYSYDLDLYPITIVLEYDPKIVKMYVCAVASDVQKVQLICVSLKGAITFLLEKIQTEFNW